MPTRMQHRPGTQRNHQSAHPKSHSSRGQQAGLPWQSVAALPATSPTSVELELQLQLQAIDTAIRRSYLFLSGLVLFCVSSALYCQALIT